MKTDFVDIIDAGTFLAALADSAKGIELAAPLNAAGDGVLNFKGMPALVRFQAESKRLFLLVGDAPDPKVLDTVLAGLQPVTDHPMYAVERQVDESGQGIFGWVNAKGVMAQLEALKDNPVVAMVQSLGGADVDSLSVGMGGAKGLGRLKFSIEMPRVGFRNYLPLIDSRLGLTAAGNPKGVLVMGLPSGKDLASFEGAMAAMQPPEKMQKYVDAKQEIADNLGYSVEQLLDTFGQDMVLMSDRAGFSMGLRVRNRDTFNKIIQDLETRLGARHVTRNIGGQAIHHLTMPSVYSLLDDGKEAEKPLVKRYIDMPQHYYWIDEGDYLLFASVPQVLIDRGYIEQRRPLADWLHEDQRMDPDGALLMLSFKTSGLHSLLYQADLGWMQAAGDYLGQPIDLFDFPTALELGLPEDGAYSLKLTSSASAFSLELGYEHNPVEFLLGGDGYSGIAVLGILAAIAVPAYNDYTLRAQVATAVAKTQDLRQSVLQSLIDTQQYPGEQAIASYDLDSLATEHYEFYMIPDSGVIGIQFDDANLGSEAVIEFQPEISEGRLVWHCVADMKEKYLPSECKE